MKPSAVERTGTELIEDSVQLLRNLPPRAWTAYFTGALPFALLLLYFVADVSRSAFAVENLFLLSFGVAFAFGWKQVWEAVFAARLLSACKDERDERETVWTRGRWFRLLSVQLALQPTSLFVLPFSFLATIPFAWTVAFYRNLSLFAGLGASAGVRLAREQALVATRQNWFALSQVSLLAFVVLVNYTVLFALLPQLAKSFFGLQNDVTRFPLWWLTRTGVAALFLLVYVTLDPLLTALYVLRCYCGESRTSGTDLRVRLQRIAPVAACVLALCLTPASVHAQPPPPPPAVSHAELDSTIDRVIRQREYSWRAPQKSERRPSAAESWLGQALDTLGRSIEDILAAIRRLFQREPSPDSSHPAGDPSAARLRLALYALGGLLAVILVLVQYRARRKARTVQATATAAAPVVVNLHDEALTADQLPESEWLVLARDCSARGDLRLALRAYYLAALSYLASRGLLTIQRWKSGLEYRGELSRRGRGQPALTPLFARNLLIFEMGWYGQREVKPEALEAFAAGLEELRQHAERG